MERERYIEMMENLKRLAYECVLAADGSTEASIESPGAVGASVFLFAHCEATMELADELLKMGIKPVAILDNNPDKYGLDYKGISACDPLSAVRNEGSGGAIILSVFNTLGVYKPQYSVWYDRKEYIFTR